MQKKITLATVKSFIRKASELHISRKSRFDGSVDCVMELADNGFHVAQPTDRNLDGTMGYEGVWFVRGSSDYFTPYNDGKFQGFEVYNCCGTFIVATKI